MKTSRIYFYAAPRLLSGATVVLYTSLRRICSRDRRTDRADRIFLPAFLFSPFTITEISRGRDITPVVILLFLSTMVEPSRFTTVPLCYVARREKPLSSVFQTRSTRDLAAVRVKETRTATSYRSYFISPPRERERRMLVLGRLCSALGFHFILPLPPSPPRFSPPSLCFQPTKTEG